MQTEIEVHMLIMTITVANPPYKKSKNMQGLDQYIPSIQ